jgi:GR25 family glycosyltransferase involved in LPS biosynthesis
VNILGKKFYYSQTIKKTIESQAAIIAQDMAIAYKVMMNSVGYLLSQSAAKILVSMSVFSFGFFGAVLKTL